MRALFILAAIACHGCAPQQPVGDWYLTATVCNARGFCQDFVLDTGLTIDDCLSKLAASQEPNLARNVLNCDSDEG